MAKKIEMSVSRLSGYKKRAVQMVCYPRGYKECLMIMGCMRSGTTLISYIFNQIRYCRVFGEIKPLSDQSGTHLRLNPLDDVLIKLNACHAPLIVCKPLVESQNASRLLKQIPRSNVLWVYRNYKDVALSNLKKFGFGGGEGNILPILQNEAGNWRNDNVADETRALLHKLSSKNLSPEDYACLFWYSRNILFFEQDLERSDKCAIWRYEDFVPNSIDYVNALVSGLGLPVQPASIVRDIYDSSIGTATTLAIHPEVEALCQRLEARLDAVFEKKTKLPATTSH